MTRVFISYRRDDSADITGRIFDRLRAHFDKRILFRDVDVIPFGSDFRQVIRKAVEDCQVLLAVIGPTWLSIASKTGTRRLDDPADFVRLEIETALKRDIPVIPVLVGKAAMPEAIHLPDSLQPLVFRHGLEVRRDPDFHRDMDTLIRGLTGHLNPTPPPVPPTPKAAARRARKPKKAVVKKAVVAPPAPKAGDRTELVLPGGVKMTFAWCPPDTFLMGSKKAWTLASKDDKKHFEYERLVHRVTLTKGFYMGIYPVTRVQFGLFVAATGYQTEAETCGEYKTWRSPGFAQTNDHPVTVVSWNDAQEFAAWLRDITKRRVRLPSEAEWEYACGAGTTTDYHTGDGEAALKEAGWYSDNSGGQTHPVGELAANAWGLHDMHGNVWEWCQDWYGPYTGSDQIDPVQLTTQSDIRRAARGCSWKLEAKFCRTAHRNGFTPGKGWHDFGFRVCFHLD